MNRRNLIIAATLLVFCNLLFAQSGPALANTKLAALPNPILVYNGQETYSTGGKNFVRYKLKVANFAAYPNALFAASPGLPPCGANTSASRTWVDIFNASNGQRIYGFCALGQSQDLTDLWFAVEVGKLPPNCVFITMTDRRLNRVYKSNRVCIPVLGDPPIEFKPDLVIKHFAFGNDEAKTIKVQVANVGLKQSGICILRLTVRRINGVPVGRTTEVKIPMINKGGTFVAYLSTKQILPNSVALADTTFKLNVDATSIVSELNEGNNEVWHNLNP